MEDINKIHLKDTACEVVCWIHIPLSNTVMTANIQGYKICAFCLPAKKLLAFQDGLCLEEVLGSYPIKHFWKIRQCMSFTFNLTVLANLPSRTTGRCRVINASSHKYYPMKPKIPKQHYNGNGCDTALIHEYYYLRFKIPKLQRRAKQPTNRNLPFSLIHHFVYHP
jgi:hypothetical protein